MSLWNGYGGISILYPHRCDRWKCTGCTKQRNDRGSCVVRCRAAAVWDKGTFEVSSVSIKYQHHCMKILWESGNHIWSRRTKVEAGKCTLSIKRKSCEWFLFSTEYRLYHISIFCKQPFKSINVEITVTFALNCVTFHETITGQTNVEKSWKSNTWVNVLGYLLPLK